MMANLINADLFRNLTTQDCYQVDGSFFKYFKNTPDYSQ